jgi:hypothetical protein
MPGAVAMNSFQSLEKLDGLYDMGREMMDRKQIHGYAVEAQFDVCRFDDWRKKIIDLLYSLSGCEDISYQSFSQKVTRPSVRDLEEGLRILAAVRDEIAKTAPVEKDEN